jgi:hypothetical protein
MTMALSFSSNGGARFSAVTSLDWDNIIGKPDITTGPAVSTEHAIARYADAEGVIEDSEVLIDDSGNITPVTSDAGSLGTSAVPWSDAFLASGGVLDWNAGDVTVTHSANALAFAGATSGYTFDAKLLLPTGIALDFSAGNYTVTHSAGNLAFSGAVSVGGNASVTGTIGTTGGFTTGNPSANDTVALGTGLLSWSDMFLASGAVINFANSNYTVTHSSGTLTYSGGLTVAGAFVAQGAASFTNTGFRIFDTNASHSLIFTPGSDLTANRTLTITTGDSDRTFTLSGNLTVSGTATIPAGTAAVLSGGQVLTGGFGATSADLGTVSSGTTTLAFATANIQRYINGGAHTLAPPSSNEGTIVVQVTNNASAGAVTVSGWTRVTGDVMTTTNGDDFMLYCSRVNGFSHLHITALQ